MLEHEKQGVVVSDYISNCIEAMQIILFFSIINYPGCKEKQK